MDKTTLPEIFWPLMGKPSIRWGHCAICWRPAPLNQHHIVKRSAGKMYDANGEEIEKPTITLCGFGNHGADANGRMYCHGLAHANRLHFRWDDKYQQWEFLGLAKPARYEDALEMDGWEVIRWNL